MKARKRFFDLEIGERFVLPASKKWRNHVWAKVEFDRVQNQKTGERMLVIDLFMLIYPLHYTYQDLWKLPRGIKPRRGFGSI